MLSTNFEGICVLLMSNSGDLSLSKVPSSPVSYSRGTWNRRVGRRTVFAANAHETASLSSSGPCLVSVENTKLNRTLMWEGRESALGRYNQNLLWESGSLRVYLVMVIGIDMVPAQRSLRNTQPPCSSTSPKAQVANTRYFATMRWLYCSSPHPNPGSVSIRV